VQKPVINWISWALTADMYPYGVRYWFPGPPWEHFEHYWQRSPLSRVGHVTTPTMLLTGKADHRTPIPESEQFYQALKLRGVPAALVRMPGAPHDIARRPSHRTPPPAGVGVGGASFRRNVRAAGIVAGRGAGGGAAPLPPLRPHLSQTAPRENDQLVGASRLAVASGGASGAAERHHASVLSNKATGPNWRRIVTDPAAGLLVPVYAASSGATRRW